MIDSDAQYLLQNLFEKERVPGLYRVIAASRDGFLKADAYRGQDTTDAEQAEDRRAEAEQMAALTTTAMTVIRKLLNEQGQQLQLLPIKGDKGWCVVMVTEERAFLTAWADNTADLEEVNGAMSRIRGAIGRHLSPAPREEIAARAPAQGTGER